MFFYLQNYFSWQIMDLKLILGVMILLAVPFTTEAGKSYFMIYSRKKLRVQLGRNARQKTAKLSATYTCSQIKERAFCLGHVACFSTFLNSTKL